MTSRALPLAFLVLSACGGAAPEPPPADVLIDYGMPPVPEKDGWTARSSSVTIVTIRPGLSTWDLWNVIAHELFHVAGWDHHSHDGTCVTHELARNDQPPGLCLEDVEILRSLDGTYALLVEDPGLELMVRDVAAWLNSYAERDVFLVP